MPQKFSTPGITRVETDLSNVVAPAGTSVGGIVGWAAQGPANQRVLITFDKEFVDKFGSPNSLGGLHGFAALEFLKESNALWFVRATSGNETYANVIFCGPTSGTSATVIQEPKTTTLLVNQPDGNKPDKIYAIDNTSLSTSLDNQFVVAAIGPGAWGNNVGIRISTAALSGATASGTGTGGAAGVSATSANYDWSQSYTYPTDVFKFEVFTKDTTATSFTGDPIETFFVSRRQDLLDGNGKNLYVETVINGVSKYVYIQNDTTNTTMPYNTYGRSTSIVALAGGNSSTAAVPQAEIQSAWSLFASREAVNVNILCVAEDGSNTTTIQYVGNLAATRKDCVAVAQADSSTSTDPQTIINGAATSFTNASYVALYAGWDLILDTFNDKKVYLPKCVFAAAIMARTDSLGNVWDAPAGVNRGVIPSVDQNIVWNDAQIGQLYDANINTSKKIRGVGNVMWGQKTAQRKKSALDRINVRRMLLFVENSVEASLYDFLFELNTSTTRLRVESIVKNFLETVLVGGGLTAFDVVCDESNNTAQVIDNNQLNVDIYVQPARSIEFIKLQTVITRTGVSLTETRA